MERPIDAEEMAALRRLKNHAALWYTGLTFSVWLAIALILVMAIFVDHPAVPDGVFAIPMIVAVAGGGFGYFRGKRARQNVRRLHVAITLGRALEFPSRGVPTLDRSSGIVSVVAPPGLRLRNRGELLVSLAEVPGLTGPSEARLPKFPARVPKRELSSESVRPLSGVEMEDLDRIPFRLDISMRPIWHLALELGLVVIAIQFLIGWAIGRRSGVSGNEVASRLQHLVLFVLFWWRHQRHELRKLWYCHFGHKKDKEAALVVAVSSGPWAGRAEVLAASRLPWTFNGKPAGWREAVEYGD